MRYLLTLACCLVLTACGKSDKKDLSGDAKPLYGGTLIYAKSGTPLTFGPALLKETESSVVLANLFAGLVRNAPVKRPSIPALPIPWEIFKDATIYTFHLRSGVMKRSNAFKKTCEVFNRDLPWCTLAHSVTVVTMKETVMEFQLHSTSVRKFNKLWLKK